MEVSEWANIVITGFMGTGKSKVGLEVACRLGREFVDVDTLIEERVGMTIPEIFAQRGEVFFASRSANFAKSWPRGAV